MRVDAWEDFLARNKFGTQPQGFPRNTPKRSITKTLEEVENERETKLKDKNDKYDSVFLI